MIAVTSDIIQAMFSPYHKLVLAVAAFAVGLVAVSPDVPTPIGAELTGLSASTIKLASASAAGKILHGHAAAISSILLVRAPHVTEASPARYKRVVNADGFRGTYVLLC